MTFRGRLVMLIAAAPILAVAVLTAPVAPPQPLGWEPQIVTASGPVTPATSARYDPSAAPSAVSSLVRSVRRALPHGIGSERGLQVQTIRVKRAISARFPQIREIGGVRPDAMKWHPQGLAIDVIIPDYDTTAGRALGDRIARFALNDVKRFGLEHVIWQRIYHPANGKPRLMTDLGDDDANHYTHVHIATYGGGLPTGREHYFD